MLHESCHPLPSIHQRPPPRRTQRGCRPASRPGPAGRRGRRLREASRPVVGLDRAGATRGLSTHKSFGLQRTQQRTAGIRNGVGASEGRAPRLVGGATEGGWHVAGCERERPPPSPTRAYVSRASPWQVPPPTCWPTPTPWRMAWLVSMPRTYEDSACTVSHAWNPAGVHAMCVCLCAGGGRGGGEAEAGGMRCQSAGGWVGG